MEEPTAKELEFQFRIKCEKYYDLQSQGETSTGEYKFIGDELLRKFQLLKNVADDEHYLWDFCNFDTYKEKIKEEKHNLKRANRSSINNDKQFYKKELRNLERKTGKTENHDNLILKHDNYIPFNYFMQTGRRLVALDFLDAQTERNIAVIERAKKAYIKELLEKEFYNPTDNFKELKEQYSKKFDEIKIEFSGLFKDFNSYLLFEYLDEHLDYDQFLKSKYSLLYSSLINVRRGSHIIGKQSIFFAFIKKYRNNLTMTKILPESNKMKKQKNKLDSLIDDFKKDFLPKFYSEN